MPFLSKAQWKLFQAKAHANPKKERRMPRGPSGAVARKFIKDAGHQKIGDLPEHVGDKKK